jgi:hypothetical protein
VSNLTDEIVQADTALQQAEIQVADASRRLRQSRREHRKCREELSRLIKELRTGESRYPLLERFEVATDDTTSTGSRHWTSADLDAQVLRACQQIGCNGESGIWELLAQQGCDDARILEVLRAQWPQTPRFEEGTRTIRGGVTPAIWMGARTSKNQEPTLSGFELADWIRGVFKIPRAQESAPQTPGSIDFSQPTPEPRKRGRPRKATT